ncbi:MAG: DUF4197 domain-containing protein [Blastocatellia bacterium]|nr:DUF4197 domain-containing protein [Blastocatellia bacterium]
MVKRVFLLGFLMLIVLSSVTAQTKKKTNPLGKIFGQTDSLSEDKIILGLKEALNIGTGNAVTGVGRLDGYFKDAIIKILMPKKLQTIEKGLRAVGYGRKVDEFVLSMNRAAEKAAPQAKAIFIGAIKEMTFDDARKILTGGDTAATTFFKDKTTDKLSSTFRPIIEKAMNEVGATKQYKDLIGRYQAIPFARSYAVDIDEYVTGKAIDGLFYYVGEEEKKIRKNPAARVTQILKDVFGKAVGR